MADKALVVLTGKSGQQLLKEGGTSAWHLRPQVVRNFRHVICARHAYPPYDPGPGDRPEAHGTAFLVAEIADVQFLYTEKGRDRFMVTFGAIAHVSVPAFWDGSRNPVRYMDVAEVKARGIDLDALQFEPFTPEEAADDAGEDSEGVLPLTIAAAKLGLAAQFGVGPEAIEITIKG